MNPRPRLAAFAGLALVACGPTYVERDTQVLTDPDAGDFWAVPFPSDLREQSDGSYAFVDWPGANDFATMWLQAADYYVRDGWGVSAGVFAQLSGSIDVSTLPTTPEASLAAEATVYLVDVDPESPARGQRIPLTASVPEPDLYTPENLLAAVPTFGFIRQPHTAYALVITDGVLDTAGTPLGMSRPLYDACRETLDADARLAHACLWLRETEGEEIVSRLAGLSVFTTGDPTLVTQRLAAWAETQAAPELVEPWSYGGETYDDYEVLTARWRVPVVQEGVRPYALAPAGRIVWDDDEPVVQDHQDVRLSLTLPKQPQPAAGFPLTLYLHGSGGNWREVIERGPKDEVPPGEETDPPPGTGPAAWLAARGIATLGFDFAMHGDRHSPSDTSGLVFYNLLGNPEATIANFQIAVMEMVLLTRLVQDLAVSAALAPELDDGGAPDGLIRFDPARLTSLSQSMGSTIGIPWAAVDPRLKGAVFSGAGGLLIETAVDAVEPFALNGLFSATLGLEDGVLLHREHPLLHAIQNLWDQVDPVAAAPYVALTPHAGIPAKQVFMPAGVLDGYFHPLGQAAVAVPLGARLAGDAVEEILPARLALAERAPLTYPVEEAADAPLIVIAQHEAPYTLGHYITFNQLDARRQIACFLATVGTSAGAQVPAPLDLFECD